MIRVARIVFPHSASHWRFPPLSKLCHEVHWLHDCNLSAISCFYSDAESRGIQFHRSLVSASFLRSNATLKDQIALCFLCWCGNYMPTMSTLSVLCILPKKIKAFLLIKYKTSEDPWVEIYRKISLLVRKYMDKTDRLFLIDTLITVPLFKQIAKRKKSGQVHHAYHTQGILTFKTQFSVAFMNSSLTVRLWSVLVNIIDLNVLILLRNYFCLNFSCGVCSTTNEDENWCSCESPKSSQVCCLFNHSRTSG